MTVGNTSGTSAPESDAIYLVEGDYRYYKTDIFDENAQKTVSYGQIYDGTSESADSILCNDRYPFGLLADPCWGMDVCNITKNSFVAYGIVYNKDGDKWRPVGSESEPDYYCVINDKDTFTLYNTYKRLNAETGEPTGEVYTEIVTYKRIQ